MAPRDGTADRPVDSNRAHFIAFFKKVLRVSDFVATALYDQQLLTDAATIAEFGNSEVDSVCQTLRRDSKLPIAELSIARLKLLTFWVRHQQRTGRVIGGSERHLVRVELADLDLLKEQKRLEDGWAANNKEPEYTAIALDLASAAKAFEKVKTILTRIRGVLGVLLVYVIRHQLIPEDEERDPEFGGEEHPVTGVCKYSSHDHELINRCPILTEDLDWDLEVEELEIQGPFVPTFLTDSKKVWVILHALFSTSSVWQHVKKFTTTQDGRQVYRTLHSHFFGKDKVNTMVNDILSSLKSKVYQGDRKNWNFDKYCLAHVAEHNRHASLTEYDVAPLEESMKIHYFEEGIKDPTLDAARNAILVDRTRFPDFDSVMQLYMTSKRSQKSEAAPPGRQLSAVTGGRGGGRGGGGAGRGGRGRGDPDARRKGLVSQADIDKVTNIENKHYPEEVYAKFTAAEKAKHWQLRNPGKERGSGPAPGGRKSGISATNVSDFASAISSAVSAISALSDTTKRPADDDEPDDDPTNRKHPALARQKKTKTDN
jgi:hypothetical protein